jgi:hypothetical protein
MDMHWCQQVQKAKLKVLVPGKVLLIEIGGVAVELNFGLFVVVWDLK